MLTADGQTAVLMDLGLAQMQDDGAAKVTQTRQFIGTLRYASPEQQAGFERLEGHGPLGGQYDATGLTGQPVDAARDVDGEHRGASDLGWHP